MARVCFSLAEQELMATSRTKLAYVVNSLNPGGTERLVVEMSKAFSGMYDITVLCLDEPGTWAGILRNEGIPVHCLWRQPGFDPALPFKLATLFRDANIKIVHAHQCTPWFYAALSRMINPTPRLLFEEHGRFYPETKKLKRIIVNRLLISRLTHRTIAVSEDIRQRLNIYEGLKKENIDVIYNGVQTAQVLNNADREACRNTFGFEAGSFVVGTVGRLDSIKNLPMLVNAFAHASRSLPALRGLLVGDGPEFNNIRSLIGKERLSDRIYMTGFRDDSKIIVQCMDLFVLSSVSEGTSMALLEAMASGIPAVVTNVGGNPEIVINGKTGWVIPSNSPESLAAVIHEAVADPKMRYDMATAAKQRYVENYTFDRMIENYGHQYRSIRISNSTAESTYTDTSL
jgi:glycosyltransferase involved in cell wall biosynthesis